MKRVRPALLVRIAAAGGTGLMVSGRAVAHTGTGLAGGFASGLEHPLTGVDHMMAMVCVGLWGALLGRPLVYALPVIFPLMMVVGAVMGMFSLPLPPVEVGVAGSVIVLGGCVALRLKLPTSVASLIVAIFAVFHGYAHGQELPSAAEPVGYCLGFVLATGSLHVAGIGVGLLAGSPAGLTVARSIGTLICGTGVWFLSKAVNP